jgi:hypothetical protein
MSARERWLPATLALGAMAALLPVLSGCGSSTTAKTPGGDASSVAAPSVSLDPHAATHDFINKGFAIAYGRDWIAQYPNGNDWYAKDGPPSQPKSWSMRLVGFSASRAQSDRPQIVIAIYHDRTALDPAVFQRMAAGKLSAENPNQVFRPVAVNKMPMLMAAFRDPNATTPIQVERYVFGSSGIVYDFELRAPVATWDADAPVMRSILQSFFLPGG